MDIFNPKILDACIRDVASCLTDNQKADLLLYAARSIRIDCHTRTIIDNAMQSCLQISTLCPEKVAQARILRARARLAAGLQFSANEDLQAALNAEPGNPEATALLHRRSVTVEKLLSPLPKSRERLSTEIWREIALYLPRKDLKSLLFVPHAISRVASQLLFRELDLYFGHVSDMDEEVDSWNHAPTSDTKDEDVRHAFRSADILTRIIVDGKFAGAVRTLKIYAPTHDKDGTMAFQTGMLTNALPKMTNLRNVHISAGGGCIIPILLVLQNTSPRLNGLSLRSSDGPADLSFLVFKHLSHFSYRTDGGSPSTVYSFVSQVRPTLRTFSIENRSWTFPSTILSIRNLTRIDFLGHLPLNSQAIADILTHGRQLESLTLSCGIDCTSTSHLFRDMPRALPFLRHFAFTVHAVSRRARDSDLFPAIAEFLRGRRQLKTLSLVVCNGDSQCAVGFNAAVWGVLPSLSHLRTLKISYPSDLAPGLASWLIPRSVRALSLTLDYANNMNMSAERDPIPFLDQLRPGVPPDLKYICLTQFPVRNVALIVEHGFLMVRVVRVGNNYWTVERHVRGPGELIGPGHAAGEGVILEMGQWPRRRVARHAAEWLEWLGCEDAVQMDGQDAVVFSE
ncbi:hypothetical protein APHAL10511_005504 [Amanita phalloides]|nr:hypothetical protein APHAL10511_005504 [Amanita phalloides]